MKPRKNNQVAVCVTLAAFMAASGQTCAAQPQSTPAGASASRPAHKQTYLYCSDINTNLSQYRIGEDGSLTRLAAKLVPVRSTSYGAPLTFTPSGRFAYIASDHNSGIISQFAVGVDGAPSPLSPPSVDTGKGPQTITIDPSGRFAYAVNISHNSVSEFRISGDGTLVPAARRAFRRGRRPPGGEEVIDNVGIAGAVDSGPRTLTFGVGGKAAYLVVFGTSHAPGQNNLYQYRLGRGGSLRPLTPARVPVRGIATGRPTLDPRGRYLYVNCSGLVYEFRIAATGALTPLPAPFQRIPLGDGTLIIEPTGRFAYVSDFSDCIISQYRIGRGGVLVPLMPADLPTGASPQAPLIDPSGRFLYVPNTGSNDVSQFRIGSDGRLIPLSPRTVPADRCPMVLSVHQQ